MQKRRYTERFYQDTLIVGKHIRQLVTPMFEQKLKQQQKRFV